MLKLQNKIPSALTIGGKVVERVLMRNEVVWGRVQTPLYIQNTYNGSNTVTIQQTLVGTPDSSTYAKHLQYSKNGLNWTTITLSSTAYTITLNQGERVYFRGNEGVFNYWYSGGNKKAITTISANQTHTVGGNINTLLDYQDPYGLTLPQGAFCGIFENNTKLTSASDITFTPSVDGSLSKYCYLYLFKKCTNLTTVPKIIPAKKQGEDSCNGMFSYTAITTAPALPATILSNGCYVDTFHGCSKLVNAPALPATEMKSNCYRALFARCTSLVNAPDLPATTLADGCYRELFFGCTSLVNPPKLPAGILKNNCYQQLFYGCSKLNSITVYARDISATNCISDWLSGVASEGIFNNYGSATYTVDSPSGIPTGWSENKNEYFYIENKYNGTNKIYLKTQTSYSKPDTGEFAKTIQYSKDKKTWTTINLNYEYTVGGLQLTTVTNLTLSLNKGEKVYFRNDNGYFCHMSGVGRHSHMFSSDENIKVGGNIKSLLNYKDMNGTKLKSGCFNNMFSGAEYLSDAKNLILNDMNLADSCYHSLFENCHSLTNAPVLPATTLARKCYLQMFKGTAITTAPKLPATKLAPYCYKNLFENCYSLTSASELPATTMVEGCYQGMFNSCTHLTTAPTLFAKTLATYSYRYMFSSCSRLNSVTSYANNISATECTHWWLEGVASSGTLHNLGTATYEKDSINGIPTGWTEVKN